MTTRTPNWRTRPAEPPPAQRLRSHCSFGGTRATRCSDPGRSTRREHIRRRSGGAIEFDARGGRLRSCCCAAWRVKSLIVGGASPKPQAAPRLAVDGGGTWRGAGQGAGAVLIAAPPGSGDYGPRGYALVALGRTSALDE